MYGKIFRQMYEGTLASVGPWEALVTFQQMIVLADKDGVIDMTADALSRLTTIPPEVIQRGIEALQEPDGGSRSPDEDGRRIVLLDEHREWGWRIVNYEHYRKLRSEEDRREYHRQYYQKNRSKAARESQESQQTSTDSTNSISRGKGKGKGNNPPAPSAQPPPKKRAHRLPEDWEPSAKLNAWALEKVPNVRHVYETEKFRDYFIGSGRTYVDWNRTWQNWMRRADEQKRPGPKRESAVERVERATGGKRF